MSYSSRTWNEHLLALPSQAGIFLQSWEWGEFERALGHVVHRTADTQVIEHHLPFGKKYWYVPRAPLTGHLLEHLKNEATAVSGTPLFIRFEPLPGSVLPPDGAVSVKNLQPTATLITRLRSDEELLSAMHPKTRYNIGLAERKGVIVKIDRATAEHLRVLWPLFEQTAARDKFRLHPRHHYETMITALSGDDVHLEAATALYNHHVSAAALLIGFGDTLTYLHGASDDSYKSAMAPHLLHWRALQWARLQGYANYDWWGIAPTDSPDELLAGVTRFKKGFGGQVMLYPSAFDLPLEKFSYTMYARLRAVNKIFRR